MKKCSSICVGLWWLLVSLELNAAYTCRLPAKKIRRLENFFPLHAQAATATTESTADTTTHNSLSIISKAKQELIETLPRMTGQEQEFRRVEELVNTLEDQYQPAQTLSFLNFALQGDWQLLFSTNLSGSPNPAKFRLRELYQTTVCDGLEGLLTTEATWDLAQQGDAVFDASGTFSVVCPYRINQGARMIVSLQDHVLKLAPGSVVPDDVEGLVGLLHRSMPKELFDPSEHGVDPTYLDADMKIVRYTGPRLEGVRDIFIRRGSLVVDPLAAK
jgi:hypothetical protein